MENINMVWIARCSLDDIMSGRHIKPVNCILLRIFDTDYIEYPKAYYESSFKDIRTFKFLDLDTNDPDPRIGSISNAQARSIAKVLIDAKGSNTNILVHCIMGISRSGGICEAAEAGLGYEYLHNGFLCPNILVKSKVLRFINILIKEEELKHDEIFN